MYQQGADVAALESLLGNWSQFLHPQKNVGTIVGRGLAPVGKIAQGKVNTGGESDNSAPGCLAQSACLACMLSAGTPCHHTRHTGGLQLQGPGIPPPHRSTAIGIAHIAEGVAGLHLPLSHLMTPAVTTCCHDVLWL